MDVSSCVRVGPALKGSRDPQGFSSPSKARGDGREFKLGFTHTWAHQASGALDPGHGPQTQPRWYPLATSVLPMPLAKAKGAGCLGLLSSSSPSGSSLGQSWLPSTMAMSLNQRNCVHLTAAKTIGRQAFPPHPSVLCPRRPPATCQWDVPQPATLWEGVRGTVTGDDSS